MSAFDRKIDPAESMLSISDRKVCGLYIPFSESAPNSGRHYIVHYFFVPLSHRQRLVLSCARQYAPYLAGVFFVKNVDYAEIQVELDGAVEERRTRPIDRAAVRHPRRLSHRQSVRNESGRKGEIAPSRPVLRRIGIAQARTDGRVGRVVGKTPSYVDLARHAGEGGLVVASARGK